MQPRIGPISVRHHLLSRRRCRRGRAAEWGGQPVHLDASRSKQGEWPGRWEQKKERFIWSFPDQHMEISGSISSPGERQAKLAGTETASGVRSAVTCTALTKLPRIGEGLVIPRDSRFIDLDGEEGELKVPAGISLQPQEP